MSVRAAPQEATALPVSAHGPSPNRLAAVLAAGMSRMCLLHTSGKPKPLPSPNAEELKNLQGVVRNASSKAKKEGARVNRKQREGTLPTPEQLSKEWDDFILNKRIDEWINSMDEAELMSIMPKSINWKSPGIAAKLAELMRESDNDSKEGKEVVQGRIRKRLRRHVDRMQREKSDTVDVENDYIKEFDLQDDPNDYVDEDQLLKQLEGPAPEKDLRSNETLGDL
jgi:ElaB/YqjD/DUF883 family membrane-anchored ribosome-binding protein